MYIAAGISLAYVAWRAKELFSLDLVRAEDVKKLSPEVRASLEAKVNALVPRVGIAKPLEIKEIDKYEFYEQGAVLIPGKAGLLISSDWILQSDEHEIDFFLAHFIIHIKNSDVLPRVFLPPVVNGITAVAIAILLPSLSVITATALALTTTVVVSHFYFSWLEKRTDLEALSLLASDQQSRIPETFDQYRLSKLPKRERGNWYEKLFKKIIYKADGNMRFSLFIQSDDARAEYCRNFIAKARPLKLETG